MKDKTDDRYLFVTTPKCLNQCFLCCLSTEPRAKIYHVGQTDTERKGLKNLFASIDPVANINLTGGDPLRNEVFLEILASHEGRTTIQFNPLSILTLELNRSASKITPKDVDHLAKRVREDGFSPRVVRLLDLLSNFSALGISSGSLQSPNPEIMGAAVNFFRDQVHPKITEFRRRKSLQYQPLLAQNVSAKFENGAITLGKETRCIGRLRRMIESGEANFTNISRAEDYTIDSGRCNKYKTFNLHFERYGDEIFLYMDMCTMVNQTPYTSYRTELSLQQMADMKPEAIQTAIRAEREKMSKRAYFRLLNDPDYLKFKTDSEKSPLEKRKKQFEIYFNAASELIRQKTGVEADFLSQTYLVNEKIAKSCDVCNTVGVMLYRTGIGPQKWQDYLAWIIQESRLP